MIIEKNVRFIPTSKKRALLVGINKYQLDGADLRGCVNDVRGVAKILRENYGFVERNMRILLNEQATKKGILNGLKWLIENAHPGEELVYHHSGHGSQMPDFNNDEKDKLDEILVPYDMDWNDPYQLNDDRLHEIFKRLPMGAFLTMICDTCHSGTMTRGIGAAPMNAPRMLPPPDFIMREIAKMEVSNYNKVGEKQRGETPQRHVLLSGCKESQVSMDAFIDNKYQGALTSSFLRVIKNDKIISWRKVHKKVVELLKKQGFAQDPQLRGAKELLERNIFGM
jgi:hypothetical protein